MQEVLPLFRILWLRLPVAVRATLIALAILGIGQLPPAVFLLAALRATPAIPWFLVATAVWLCLLWSWLDGRGWPFRSASVRRSHLRARRLSLRTWGWALLAGGLGICCVLGGALLTGMLTQLPAAAYEAPFDLDGYPPWTKAACFFNIALVAGVVEEAAFRGYMLSMLERRHGWIAAILGTSLLFYVVHLGHAYATSAFIPFFAAYSLLHGTLVWMTRSIRPSVVVHVVGDSVILPMQFGVVVDPLGDSIALHAAFVAAMGALALVAFWQLRRISVGTRR